jgi:DNA-binding response OmpR family regulator
VACEGKHERRDRDRSTARTRRLAVLILTSSDADHERLAGYSHHATAFLTKPLGLDRFMAAARQLGLSWTLTPPRGTA